MLSKAKIKLINQLKRKKYRELHNMFLVEGSKNVIDFIKSNTELSEIFATEDWIQKHHQYIVNHKASIVTANELDKITALSAASEVLAIFSIPDTNYNGIVETENFAIAIDNISDPGNLGTIIRTADWFGIKHIYCSTNTVDAFNPKVVQATMGSLSRVNVIYTNLENMLNETPMELPIFGAVLNGNPITELQPQRNGIILIGSEAHGISDELLQFITHKITIPYFNQNSINKAESLNASIANAIICYALISIQK